MGLEEVEWSQATRGQKDQKPYDVAVCICYLVGMRRANMNFRTDYVLTQDKSFKKYAKAYAEDQDLFFKECVFKFSLSLCLMRASQFLCCCRTSIRAGCSSPPVAFARTLDHEVVLRLDQCLNLDVFGVEA